MELLLALLVWIVLRPWLYTIVIMIAIGYNYYRLLEEPKEMEGQ